MQNQSVENGGQDDDNSTAKQPSHWNEMQTVMRRLWMWLNKYKGLLQETCWICLFLKRMPNDDCRIDELEDN